jgi:methylmalonyl-CoA epimerase
VEVLGIHHVAAAESPGPGLAGLLAQLGVGVAHTEAAAGFVERMAPVGVTGGAVQLLEPTGPGTVRRFVDRHGPGLHHLALAVGDIDLAVAELVAAGVRMIDELPRPGGAGTRIAFIHPSAAGGVLLELVEDHLFPLPASGAVSNALSTPPDGRKG